MKILVVEDNRVASLAIQRLLHRLGYDDIKEANNGRKALQHLDREPFDLLITDWMMPGINGLDLVRHVRARENGHRLPILMVSVRGLPEDIQKAIAAGVDAYILKPLRRKILKKKIEKLLSNSDIEPRPA
ncbi:MAG: response regulator [Rhodothermales bacterium]